jgi:acetyl esterase/lipase
MAIEEISKVHKELGKLFEESFEFRRKIAREFATQKNIPLGDFVTGKVDGATMLEFNRYINEKTGEKRAKVIPKDLKIEEFKIGNIPAEWISVPGANEDKIYFRLYGGGYIMGTLKSRRFISYHISRTTNLRNLSIEYRLAPEHPFPAALEDSLEGYRWLLSNGFDPKKIIIGGESAGGGLTVATLLKIKESKLSMPAGAVLMSPWADLTGSGRSLETNQKYEPLIKDGIENMAKQYAKNEPLNNPLISPVFADLTGLPPLLIQAGGIEALVDDSNMLADRAKNDGVNVSLEIYENMTHVFHNFGDDLSESRQAFESINKFVQKLI